MIKSENINLSSLGVPKVYQNILNYHNIKEGRDLVNTLELYKIMTRNDIAKFLNMNAKNDSEIVFLVDNEKSYTTNNVIMDASVTKVVDRTRKIPNDDKITSYENRDDIVIDFIDNVYYIYYDILKGIDMSRYDYLFNMYIHYFRGILPSNLEELKGRKLKRTNDILLFRRIIAECVKHGASDCRFEVITHNKGSEVKIRFRVDETLVEFNDIKLTQIELENMLSTVIREISTISLSEFTAIPETGTLENLLCDGKLEGRFGSCKLIKGYLFNVRMLEEQSELRDIYHLGFDNDTVNVLRYIQNKRSGITLITGPQKTGKSTTLWALSKHFASQPLACIEYSNPVEVKLNIPQVDYKGDLNLLRSYLKVAVKQNLDVAFLNEIPDKDTAQAVRTLATASIHVLTTFHIDRIWFLFRKLYEFYGDNFKSMLSQINAVINQKMYVRLCPYCSKDILVTSLDEPIRSFLLNNGINYVKESLGCEHCNHGELIGGRLPLAEYIIFSDDLVQKLLTFNTDIEMEIYMKDMILNNPDYVKREVALEYKLIRYIKNNILSYKSLYTIL